jgi:hypothetical protein
MKRILLRLEPAEMKQPSSCLHEGCQGEHFRLVQEMKKNTIRLEWET